MNSTQSNERRTSLNLDRTRQQLRELDQLLQQMLALPTDGAGGEPATAVESQPATAAPAPQIALLEEENAEPPVFAAKNVSVAVVPPPLSIRLQPQPQIVSLRVYAPPKSEPAIAVSSQPTPEPAAQARVDNSEPAVQARVDNSEPAAQASVDDSEPAAQANVDDIEPAVQASVEALSPTSASPEPAVAAQEPGPTPRLPLDTDLHLFDLSGPVDYDLSPDHDLETLGAPSPAEGSPPYRALVGANRFFDRLLRLFGPLGRPFTTPTGRSVLGWTGLILLLIAAAICVVGWFSWPEPWQILK